MLIPRFTVRWLLALMAICGVVAFVISLAVSGRDWAMAMTIAAAGLILTFAMYAATFCVAWGLNHGWRFIGRGQKAASPFAMHTPPPQLIRAPDPD